jgi:hypothetical protein
VHGDQLCQLAEEFLTSRRRPLGAILLGSEICHHTIPPKEGGNARYPAVSDPPTITGLIDMVCSQRNGSSKL